MKRQKSINKMLRNIKNEKEVFSVYGKVFKVMLSHLLIVLDTFIISFRVITYIALKYCSKIEIFRITLKK